MSDPFGPIRWFDWDAVQKHHGTHLPHYEIPGAIYFITCRLWDSLPSDIYAGLITAREQYLLDNPSPHTEQQETRLKQVFSVPLERYLDQGRGQCVLRRPEIRDVLTPILLRFDGDRYQVGDYVIMPNHVHLLMRMRNDLKMPLQCRSWTNYSAREINPLLNRTGRLWQVEPFDHIVRSPAKLKQCSEYIRKNPRYLPKTDFTLGCGSLVCDSVSGPPGLSDVSDSDG